VEEATPSLTLIILNRALSAVGLIVPACRGLGDAQPVKQEAWSGLIGTQLAEITGV